MHINCKAKVENHPIPGKETIFHNLYGTSYFGLIDLLTPTIKMNRTKKQVTYDQLVKIGALQDVLTISGIAKLFFNLPEVYRINAQVDQGF